ncbi:MAG: hypothetical protein RMI79_05050 [Nitrososphaerota archaeon]|nr:hypothetical protein [Nitrososphaerota archaeon]
MKKYSEKRKMGIGGGRREKKRSVRKTAHIIVIIVMATAAPAIAAIMLQPYFRQRNINPPNINQTQTPKKTAIIDSIGLTRPNPEFIEEAKRILSEAGLSVDIYEGEKVTINLLRRISGYELLIFRTHSAVAQSDGYLYIFSAERYNRSGYKIEQLEGIVREARPFIEGEGPYFALRADQLGGQGGLEETIIILMGCNGTNSQKTIKTLLIKGAKAIIAWNGYVDLNYTDKITLNLIKAVYAEAVSYPEAVKKLMEQHGPDPIYKSKLEYTAQPSA